MADLGTFDADTMDGYDSEETAEATSASAAAVIKELDAPVASIDATMHEVEKRLEIASYYRLLLEDNLFTDASEAATKVNAEVRDFVRRRLEVLMGIRADKKEVEAQFSKEEVVALKAVAAKVMKQPVIVAPKAPEIRKAEPTKPAQVVKFEAKRKPGRPKKETPAAAPAPAAPAAKKEEGDIKVGTLLDGKGNVIKRNAKFKRIVAPNGQEHDLEITEQAGIENTRAFSKQELEMIYETQAHAQVSKFSPEAANAAVAVITASKDKGEE